MRWKICRSAIRIGMCDCGARRRYGRSVQRYAVGSRRDSIRVALFLVASESKTRSFSGSRVSKTDDFTEQIGEERGITLVVLCLGVALLGLMWSATPIAESRLQPRQRSLCPFLNPRRNPPESNPPEPVPVPAKTADPGIRTGVDRKGFVPDERKFDAETFRRSGHGENHEPACGSPAGCPLHRSH